jgi:enamine deaminase RidA (YjgF/YER057c/UK114 family)
MTAERTNISSGSPFEDRVGYCRAVRVGPTIVVSGTTCPGEGVAEQARGALAIIAAALQQVGASLSDVIRTRMYITDIEQWLALAQVHAEVFGEIRPAATLVEVSALIDRNLLIEIEVDAYVPASG